MYGREKSDPAIVAVKPANNARRLAAELVEPRAGVEGNASQQSTRRAQHRESVSQALERVRQVARQRGKERFTALLHHLSIPMRSNCAPVITQATSLSGMARAKRIAQNLTRFTTKDPIEPCREGAR
jgi:hypothetical protein